MATEILSAGAGAASSGEITGTQGATVMLFLKPAAGEDLHPDSFVDLQFKTAGGGWVTQCRIGGGTRPSAVTFPCPPAYRVNRGALPAAAACGVDQA